MKALFKVCSLSLALIVSSFALAIAQETKLLMVTAHPDDDALFSGTVYRLTKDFGGKADLMLTTNGEGGYKYSTLAESIYGLKLTDEKVGREYLPSIRKQELMAGGRYVGIRNYFFIEEPDKEYTQNMEEVFSTHWDTVRVKQRMREVIHTGNYDLMFVMLPTPGTHGHHKGAAILAMQVVMELPKEKRPVVLAGTMYNKDAAQKPVYTGLEGYPITKVSNVAGPFEFDRTKPFGHDNRLNYKIIASWVIAEHKSQGTMQHLMNRGDVEYYFYFDINGLEGQAKTEAFFNTLAK